MKNKETIVDVVNSTQTKYKEGFLYPEMEEILNQYDVDMDLFNESMFRDTALNTPDGLVTYQVDLIYALQQSVK